MTDDARIAELIAALDSPDKPALRAAVDALISLASAAAGVREILQRRLNEAGHHNYWPVAYVLGHLQNPSNRCMETLIEGLDHREADIRWAIALLLVQLAKKDDGAVHRLTDLCARGTGNQKRMALYCLRDLALSDPESLAAMLGALGDRDPTVRVAAAISLKGRTDLDEDGKKALLQVYLKDTAPRVRHAMAITLAGLGSPSEEFLKALDAARDSSEPQIRKAARTALKILENERSASSGPTRGR